MVYPILVVCIDIVYGVCGSGGMLNFDSYRLKQTLKELVVQPISAPLPPLKEQSYFNRGQDAFNVF